MANLTIKPSSTADSFTMTDANSTAKQMTEWTRGCNTELRNDINRIGRTHVFGFH